MVLLEVVVVIVVVLVVDVEINGNSAPTAITTGPRGHEYIPCRGSGNAGRREALQAWIAMDSRDARGLMVRFATH